MSSKLVKQARPLLLRLLIVSIGFWTMPAQAQVSDTQVGALVEALRLAAPQTSTDNHELYSDWQIKPENIPRWSQQCIGRQLTPTQFESSPVTARGILVCVMRELLQQQYLASSNNESVAVQRAAAWWMTGDANSYNSHPSNSYTHSYIQKVLNLYQQQKGNAQVKTTLQTSATARITDAQVGALVEALRLAAPQTGSENDRLYSDWQIKPENIPHWSQQCIGRQLTPTQFESSPVTARGILVCVMRELFQQQYLASSNSESVAVQRAAAWWMTGEANSYNSHSSNSYTHSYIQKVLSFYQQEKGNAQVQPTPTPPPQTTATRTPPPQTTATQTPPPQTTTTQTPPPQPTTTPTPPPQTTTTQTPPPQPTTTPTPPPQLTTTPTPPPQPTTTPTPPPQPTATQTPPPQTTTTRTPPPQTTASNSSTAPISNAQVLALVEALRLAAPQTGSENDGLYSDWQIKPEKISLWSQRCMGREVTPEYFAANPATARTILLCVMGNVLRQQHNVSNNNEYIAVRRTASWWLTGDPERYNSDATASYTERVLELYRQ